MSQIAGILGSHSQGTTEAAAPGRHRALAVGYWVATVLFCLQMGFTAYAQLTLPEVASAFAHLGVPDWLRIELSTCKLLGIAVLLLPAPWRLKEWAYAGFAINLVSAVIAHLAVGDGPEAWGFAVATGVLWALSYATWRRRSGAGRSPTSTSLRT